MESFHSSHRLVSATSVATKSQSSLFFIRRQGSLTLRALKIVAFSFHGFLIWIVLLFQFRHVKISSSIEADSNGSKVTESEPRKAAHKGELPLRSSTAPRQSKGTDVLNAQDRRALAQNLHLMHMDDNYDSCWTTYLFLNSRRQTIFTQSWTPGTKSEMKGLLILLHGLNEHSGRYAHFARKLNSQGYGVFAMDWIGHGGSDGLHGYVASLDHVVADMKAFLHRVTTDNPGVPCFLFGHSTGGAVVLKTALHPPVERMVKGIIMTSPALKVRPSHPVIEVIAPIFSLLLPRSQFKCANKRGIAVSRDPAALVAKYSDPLVFTGPIRVRTGHEILRITSYLQRNLRKVTVPFLVLHGTADEVTDPCASQDLHYHAASKNKNIKLYEGFLHDLLFEPEKEEIMEDIIRWMDDRIA
eukprot:c23990_g1_i1 orf=534-1772(+)